MSLPAILGLTFVAGTGSVWISHALMQSGRRFARWFDRGTGPWQGAAAGALLATAFLFLLPEALESAASHHVCLVVLCGLCVFFALERAELWHHGHEHAGSVLHKHRGAGALPILVGDALHALGDGVLVAAAFASDERSGFIAALAVTAHEIPHHAGDLAIVGARAGGALAKVSIAGAFCVLGGAAGWWLAGSLQGVVPDLLALACSSFIYVALSDLLPQLQRPGDAREGGMQLASIVAGASAAVFMGFAAPGH